MSHAPAAIAPLNQGSSLPPARVVSGLAAAVRADGDEALAWPGQVHRIGPDAPSAGGLPLGGAVKGLVRVEGRLFDTHPTRVPAGDVIHVSSVTFNARTASTPRHSPLRRRRVDASGPSYRVYQQNAAPAASSPSRPSRLHYDGLLCHHLSPDSATSQPGIYNFTS